MPPGLAAWLQQVYLKNGKVVFEEGIAQVCGAVSKAEEEELCSKQLEIIIAKLSHPGVSASTMADCMVCIVFLFCFQAFTLSGEDHPHCALGF